MTPRVGSTLRLLLDNAAGTASLPLGIPNVAAPVETVVFGGWVDPRSGGASEPR